MVADRSLMMMRPPSFDVLPRFQCGASSLWTRRPQRELRRSSSSPPSLCSPSSSSSAPLSVVEFPRLTYSSHAAPSAVVDAFRPGRFAVGIAPRSAPSSARPPHAATTETAGDGEGLKWWERYGAPNMFDVHSTQQFVDALAAAGDKLVVVEFFASWCPSCRALFPKFCKMAAENSDMYFLKVNFDENKPMCKRLNVKVLPFFHIYRGAEGRLDSFSCSLSKLQRLRDAIAKHHDGTCEDCAPPELIGDALDSLLEKKPLDQPAAAGRSSE